MSKPSKLREDCQCFVANFPDYVSCRLDTVNKTYALTRPQCERIDISLITGPRCVRLISHHISP